MFGCLFGSLLAALYIMAWVSLTLYLLLTLSGRDSLLFVAVTLGSGLFPSYLSWRWLGLLGLRLVMYSLSS